MTPTSQASSDTYPLSANKVDPAWEALRAIPTALLIVLEDGFVGLASAGASALLERTTSEIEGAPVESLLVPLDELLHPSSPDGLAPKIRVALPSGRYLTLTFSLSEMAAVSRGDDKGVYSLALHDVTAFERIREERDRLLQIATVHEVLPAILHEIKNPLAAIATTAELLVEEAICENERASAHAILSEARRMRRLLQGIGAAGGQLRTKQRHSAVDYALREVGAMLRAKAEAEGIRLELHVPDMPLLPLDSSVLAAIVHNLVTNAIQASSPSGEVRLVAHHDERKQRLTLRVSDTGVGMAPEILTECRKLFYSTKPKGTGIGLTLCDRAIRAASGSMNIDSALGGGTVITLCIPTTPLEAEASRSLLE